MGKSINDSYKFVNEEKEKNISAVVELIDYLYPLLTEEQNDKVREITNKIIN